LLNYFEQRLPYIFVADEALPLSENLMRPYPKRSVSGNIENTIFNYRLSRARQTLGCTQCRIKTDHSPRQTFKNKVYGCNG